MLSKKLKLTHQTEPKEIKLETRKYDDITSKHFCEPFWKQFYNIECLLNIDLKTYTLKSSKISHYYNVLDYTSDLHCAYLNKYLNGPKKLVFIGMNPGPNGMAQTGIPFGNVKIVKDLMKLDGIIGQPDNSHPKRPVTGLKCTKDEPSGKRFWNKLLEISENLEIFSQQCFMHNFCPLIFFDTIGHNITPNELKGEDKSEIRNICLNHLHKEIELLNPEIVIAVGSYVYDSLKITKKLYPKIKFLQLPHPSPRSLNNTNWPEKAQTFFEENNLLSYLTNEIV